MEAYINNLQELILKVEHVCEAIENREDYMAELKEYIPELNQVITEILTMAADITNTFSINESFVVQVLEDMVYGITNMDSVYLLDTLRYGLLEILQYTAFEREKFIGGGAYHE